MTTITNPEAIAALIYESMVRAHGYANTPTPWQAGGNSLAQDEARATADKIIKALAAENAAQKALIARLVEALEKLDSDTRWMIEERLFLTKGDISYARAAITAAKEAGHDHAAE